MKKVFTADKGSYGSEFWTVCDTLDELKKAIIDHHYYMFEDEDLERVYSDALFKEACAEGEYTPFEVDLHPEERIQFDGYDGTSWFSIEKIDKGILSRSKRIEE